MTGKRFKYQTLCDDYNHVDVLDGEKWIGCCHVDSAEDFCKAFNTLADENEELKKGKTRYELLYRHAEEEISNRILSIKEHIENCSDKQVKKSLTDLFYSEVIEYDISKENRRLRTENDELKVSINNLCNEINERDTMTNTEILFKLMNILK